MKKTATKKIKKEWDLTLLYKSPKDPQIEKDMKKIERAYVTFEKKYRDKDFTTTDKKLVAALKDYERLLDVVSSAKPLLYFHYTKELDSTNQYAVAQLRKFEERITKAGNCVYFFEINIGSIKQSKQKHLLGSHVLKPYRYYLQNVFASAKHDLTEPEERILSLKSAPARGMWVEGVESVVSKMTVRYEGKDIPLSEAFSKTSTILNVKKRRALAQSAIEKLMEAADFAEHEINAVYTNKKINDELRGYKNPYDATLLRWENSEKSIMALISATSNNFDVPHRFYRAKKKYMGLQEMLPVDAGADIGKIKTEFTFKKSADIVHETFSNIDTRYARVLEQFLAQGQIDALPRRGKSGGAYQSGVHGLPTYVFLNHINDLGSLSTLAHEMGHAIHTERSAQSQPILYEDYTIPVAEVASTFFEELALQHVIEGLRGKEKLYAMHDKLIDTLGNVFATTAQFTFESDLHAAIRAQGFVPKEHIAQLFNEHTARYRGRAVSTIKNGGYAFIRIPHVRIHYYSYPYAFGKLISRALVARYKENPTYIKEIDKFLCAGSSKSPEAIFKDIGIDISKRSFWEEGIRSIARDVKEFEQLVNSTTKN